MARFEGVSQDFIDFAEPAVTADALYELGMQYCVGRGVDIDLVAAHQWFNLSAVRGNFEARLRRAELSLEMTREQIARAQRLAREWLFAH